MNSRWWRYAISIGLVIVGMSRVSVQADSNPKKIVIVPDRATFVYVLSTWSDTVQFPIFIGETKYARQFAAAYNNGNTVFEYIEKKSIPDLSESVMYKALLASLTDKKLDEVTTENPRESYMQHLKEQNIVPPGIVITNLTSPEFCGGLALTAHHNQIVELYEPPITPIFGNYTSATKDMIRTDMLSFVRQTGFPYEGIGEGIDAITLALDMPFKYEGGYALDDAINRLDDESQSPYAFTGRLMEVEDGAALYQAMCSIFLTSSRGLFFDQWPLNWQRALLQGYWDLAHHLPCVLLNNSFAEWRHLTDSGNEFDVVFINSSGYPDKWNEGRVEDIPATVPAVVYFAHSGSAANPRDTDTIAGRWLANGAFIYYGAISEPYSVSFNLSQVVLNEWVKGTPFGQAAQQKETLMPEYRKPWKLFYIGDPLYYARFSVQEKDQLFFLRIKKILTDLENLSFGRAEYELESLLTRNKSLGAELLYYQTPMKLLHREYELGLLERLFGIQISANYSVGFVRAWFAEYPVIDKWSELLEQHRDQVIPFYRTQYLQIRGRIGSYTYLDSVWYEILHNLIRKKVNDPQWKAIGPVSAEQMDEIINSGLQSSHNEGIILSNSTSYRIHTIPTNRTTNVSMITGFQSEKHSLWIAQLKVRAEEDVDILLHLSALSTADIYLDQNQIGTYKQDDWDTFRFWTITMKEGEHTISVVFRPEKNHEGVFEMRLTDSDRLPLENLLFIP